MGEEISEANKIMAQSKFSIHKKDAQATGRKRKKIAPRYEKLHHSQTSRKKRKTRDDETNIDEQQTISKHRQRKKQVTIHTFFTGKKTSNNVITNNRIGRNIEIPRILAPTRTRKRKRTKEYSTSKKTVRTGIQTALTNYMLDPKKVAKKK